MGVVIFNGISTKDYGIQVEHPPGYQTPERDYDIVHVPGRNGDIVVDKGSYQNVTREYQIAVGSYQRYFTEMANCISEWVHSASGYARLEDSYEPDYYRMAIFKDELTIENIMFHAGRVTVSFNCKPQRFLKVGDRTYKLTNREIIRNPTRFKAQPIITLYGSGAGALNIGECTVSVLNMTSSLVIDCEMQDAYRGTTNCNRDIKVIGGFPELLPGNNKIIFSGGITSVEVVPKWWTI